MDIGKCINIREGLKKGSPIHSFTDITYSMLCNIPGETSWGGTSLPLGRSASRSPPPSWTLPRIPGMTWATLSLRLYFSSPGALWLWKSDPSHWRHSIPDNPWLNRLVSGEGVICWYAEALFNKGGASPYIMFVTDGVWIIKNTPRDPPKTPLNPPKTHQWLSLHPI